MFAKHKNVIRQLHVIITTVSKLKTNLYFSFTQQNDLSELNKEKIYNKGVYFPHSRNDSYGYANRKEWATPQINWKDITLIFQPTKNLDFLNVFAQAYNH